MKRLAPVIAAALLTLTACVPAADTAAETASSPTPDATAAPAAEPTAGPVGALHTTTRFTSFDNTFYQVVPDYSNTQEKTGTNVYKTDLSSNETTLLYHADSLFSSISFATDDTLYLISGHKLLALPLAGGTPREIPYEGSKWVDVLYDERYLYSISINTAPYARTEGQRLDLQTGETFAWDIPAETTNVLDAVNGQLLTCRILSDSPIPFPDDSEISDAFLQNSACEFDLTDAATGQPVQTLLSYPWYGEDDGTATTYYYYLGHNGSDIYFSGYHTLHANDQHSVSVRCVHSDGTQDTLDIAKDWNCAALDLDGELHWFMTYNSDMTVFTFYDLQGNQIGRNTRPAGLSVYRPITLLDDGRMVLIIDNNSDSAQFAVIDADAFLNGSTEYTELEFVG